MSPSSLRVALQYIAQNQDISLNQENPDSGQMTPEQKSIVIEDSLDAYYSSILETSLRKYDNLGQLIVAALYAVSQFGDSSILTKYFQKKLNIKNEVIRTLEEIAKEDKNSLKQTFLTDPKTTQMNKYDLDKYINSYLRDIKKSMDDVASKINFLKS